MKGANNLLFSIARDLEIAGDFEGAAAAYDVEADWWEEQSEGHYWARVARNDATSMRLRARERTPLQVSDRQEPK